MVFFGLPLLSDAVPTEPKANYQKSDQNRCIPAATMASAQLHKATSAPNVVGKALHQKIKIKRN